jgi:hypothetical protein
MACSVPMVFKMLLRGLDRQQVAISTGSTPEVAKLLEVAYFPEVEEGQGHPDDYH